MEKKGSMFLLFIFLIATLLLAYLWNIIPAIKDSVHAILDPTAGALLKWNLTWGMTILVFLITLAMTLVQKYTTDQKALKELKNEQKVLQEEMKKYKDRPEKIMELNKKNLEIIPKTFQLTMSSIIYTGIPIVLLFRWFMEVFAENPKFFGFFTWIWYYILLSIIFSIILRKIFKVY